MVLASDYPFLGVLWSMIVFFLWIAWFVMLFQIIGDVFRRDDVSWLEQDRVADLPDSRPVHRRLHLPDRQWAGNGATRGGSQCST